MYLSFPLDPNQVLKWCLGSTALGTQYGAVSTLGINNDCSRLLAGFARGQVTIAFCNDCLLFINTSDSFAISIGGECVPWVCINLCL